MSQPASVAGLIHSAVSLWRTICLSLCLLFVTEMCEYVSIAISAYLSYISIYICSIYLSIYLSIHLCLYMFDLNVPRRCTCCNLERLCEHGAQKLYNLSDCKKTMERMTNGWKEIVVASVKILMKGRHFRMQKFPRSKTTFVRSFNPSARMKRASNYCQYAKRSNHCEHAMKLEKTDQEEATPS